MKHDSKPEPIRTGEIEEWCRKDSVKAEVNPDDTVEVTIDLDLLQMSENMSDSDIAFLKNILDD